MLSIIQGSLYAMLHVFDTNMLHYNFQVEHFTHDWGPTSSTSLGGRALQGKGLREPVEQTMLHTRRNSLLIVVTRPISRI